MAKRDRSAEAVARRYFDEIDVEMMCPLSLVALIEADRRAERARVRRIVRRVKADASYRTNSPEAYGRYCGIHEACKAILAALREGKGTKG